MVISRTYVICSQVQVGVNKTLTDFFEVVRATAVRLPETRFVLVEPMQRPAVEWYQEGLTELTKAYSEGLANLQLINVSIVKRFDLPSQYFTDDNVHLTDAMGVQFLQAIVYYAEKVYEAVVVDLEKMDTDVVPVAASTSAVVKDHPPGVATTRPAIQEQIDSIVRDTQQRRHHDSMVTARIREEMDHLINTKKENKLIVTGLECRTAMPSDKVEGKKWMDELVGEALDYLVKDSSKEIAFIMPGRKIEKGVPTMFEVRMKDKEIALKVRKGFSACMRDKAQMQADNRGRMFVANSVTLATRVRTDVLKAIAKRFSNDNEDLFVIGFTSRPVLTVKRKDSGSQYALTYVDAVSRFGEGLSRGELQVAYGRAGNSFAGQLQQNFVVLHDKGEGNLSWGAGARPGLGAGPAMGGGKKRGNEEMGDTESAKRRDWGGARGGPRGGAGGGKGGGKGRGKPNN